MARCAGGILSAVALSIGALGLSLGCSTQETAIDAAGARTQEREQLRDSCVVADALVPPDSVASHQLLALTQRSEEIIDSAFMLITGVEIRRVGEPESDLGSLLGSPDTLLTYVIRYFPSNAEGWLMRARIRREQAFAPRAGVDVNALHHARRYAGCAARLVSAGPTRRSADSLARLLESDLAVFRDMP